jgi:hypothetical protein
MIVTRLDRRHNCHGIMKYHVETGYDIWGSDLRIARFKEWRAWCWEQFGPGTESKWIVLQPVATGNNGECRMESVERWAWHTEHNEMRLYFKSDAELAWFKLKWEQPTK